MNFRSLPRRRYTRRSLGHVLAGALAGLAVGCHASGPGVATVATSPPSSPPRTSIMFASGLDLVIDAEPPGTGRVGVMTLVEAGAGDEPSSLGGLAHFVEHLVFASRGPDGLGLRSKIERLGGTDLNASTTLDVTEFHALAPSSHILELLAAEVEALSRGTSGLSADAFERERKIVVAEGGFRSEVTKVAETLVGSLYPAGHPMRLASAIGTPRSVAQIRLDDVDQFMRQHYVPKHITVYVTGDLGGATPEALARVIPAAWRGHKTAPDKPERRPLATEIPPAPAGAADLAVVTVDRASPLLFLGWSIPADAFPSLFLERSVTLRMSRLLEARYEEETRRGFGVRGVSVHVLDRRRGGVLVVQAAVEPGSPTDALARDMASFVGVLPDRMISRGDVDSREQFATAMRLAAEGDDLDLRMEIQGRWAHLGTEPSPEEALDVDARDRALARLVPCLKADRARGVLLRPAEFQVRKGGSDTLRVDVAPPDDLSLEDESAAAPASHEALLAAIAPLPSGALHQRALSNGLTLVSLDMPHAPLGAALVGFRSPVSSALDVTAGQAFEASAERALIHENGDTFSHQERFLPDRYEALLERWAFVQRGDVRRWPPRGGQLATRREWDATPKAALWRRFQAALWEGQVHGFAPTAAEIAGTPWSAIKAWSARLTSPPNGVVVVVGAASPQRLEEAAEQTVGTWAKQGDGGKPAPPSPPLGGPHSLVILKGQQETVDESVAWWGCRLPSLRTTHDEAVADVLTAVVGGALAARLRGELGTSYAPDVRLGLESDGSATILGWFDIHGPVAPASAAMSALFGGQRPLGPTEAQLERARWKLIGSWNELAAKPRALANALFHQWRRHLPVEDLVGPVRALADVTRSEVEEAWKVCAQHATLALAEGRAP